MAVKKLSVKKLKKIKGGKRIGDSGWQWPCTGSQYMGRGARCDAP